MDLHKLQIVGIFFTNKTNLTNWSSPWKKARQMNVLHSYSAPFEGVNRTVVSETSISTLKTFQTTKEAVARSHAQRGGAPDQMFRQKLAEQGGQH